MTEPFDITPFKTKTGWKFDTELGITFSPRFFCCTDPNELGIVGGKEPVAIINLEPRYVYAGDSIDYDGTNSYDPDGTVTDWDWSFEGGTPSSSILDTQTVIYEAAGIYTTSLTVTDGTGNRSVPASIMIIVGNPGDFDTTGVYVGSQTGVRFSIDIGTTWHNLTANLSGDSLIINDLRQDPASFEKELTDEQVIWLATNGGIYVSNNGSGTEITPKWHNQTPTTVSNKYDDTPAPTVADLVFTNLQFFGNRLYVTANWENGDGVFRGWIFFADVSFQRMSPSTPVAWGELA